MVGNTLVLNNGDREGGVKENSALAADVLGGGEWKASSAISGGVVGTALSDVVALEADVAVLAEDCRPGVADEPVLAEGHVLAVPYELHNVVKVNGGIVGAPIEDAAVVEVPVGGIDVDGEGTSTGEGADDGVLVVLGELHVVGDLGVEGALGAVGAVTGVTVEGGEGVRPLLGETTGTVDVVEGKLGNGTHAAAGSTAVLGVQGARGDLLGGKGEEVAVHNGLHGLDGLSGGVGPAISTITLVLDGTDDLRDMVTPVYGVGDGVVKEADPGDVVGLDGGEELLGVTHGSGAATIKTTALLKSPVGHVVEGHGPAALVGVVGKNLGLVLLEDAAASAGLVDGVLAVVLGAELLEAVALDLVELGLGLGGEGTAGHQKGGDDDSLHLLGVFLFFL